MQAELLNCPRIDARTNDRYVDFKALSDQIQDNLFLYPEPKCNQKPLNFGNLMFSPSWLLYFVSF
jgi:hypothetical protein